MTVGDIEERMGSAELTEWFALCSLEAQEADPSYALRLRAERSQR